MSDFVGLLVDMGFDPEKAKKAVEVTGNRGVEPAMEWILANPDTGVVTEKDSTVPQDTAGQETEGDQDVTVRSYKCDECGKQLKDAAEMEYHAAKTQHSKFSESTDEKKPLTAEEKAAQLQRIEQKLKEKRAEREAKEKEEAIVKEKSRIKHGKEIIEAKRRMAEQEMKEIAETRRREKIEERQARERVRAQIEADKAARKAKQEATSGNPPASLPTQPSPAQSTTSTDQPSASMTGISKDYTEAKIQIRLPNGKQLVQTFAATEPLAAVRVFIEMNRDDGISGPFNLMITHPRKIFGEEEYDAPLQSLGLVPRAVLVVTKTV